MELPQEIIVWYVLPALRKELTIELKKQGLSQKDIAEKLSITPAAVSQYMSRKRASMNLSFSSRLRSEIRKSAKTIMQSDSKNAGAKELVNLVKISQKEKTICMLCSLKGKDCAQCSS